MYDVVIIGSGPAGHTAALEAAKYRLKVAVIEREPEKLGGVCLNEGCIPLKGLLHYSTYETDYNDIRNKVMQKVALIRNGLKARMEYAVTHEEIAEWQNGPKSKFFPTTIEEVNNLPSVKKIIPVLAKEIGTQLSINMNAYINKLNTVNARH